MPVVTVGEVSDVRPYFACMDVHVLPTLREGFPNVVLEAGAMGVPTVTTRATGSVDSVEHDVTGLLVAVNDPEGLADARSVRFCATQISPGKLGSSARVVAVERFNPGAVVRSHLRPAFAGWDVRGRRQR